jgi:D-3-phosphoglycerate dehydrogenase / 2-oxoglutarate reductase
MMSDDRPVVVALGQSWNDLKIEEEILARAGAAIVDGRKLPAEDPAWDNVAGVLLGTAARLDRERLAALAQSGCKGVVRYGIGYDNVDAAAATELGMVAAIVREYCIEEVAEHAVACGLALARGLSFWDRTIREGAWRGSGGRPSMHRLSMQCFGVVGFGLIGRTAALKAKGLFGRVLIYDPAVKVSDEDRALGLEGADSLDDLLGAADLISVHLPLIPATRNLIDSANLARMKPTAYVINVSRGGIVDEAALIEAVRSGTVAGGALDTFVKEPLPADDPLMAEPRILLSPHVAWLSDEAAIDLRRLATEEMVLILRGEEPTTRVTE